jgi:hypothetical protein
VISQISDMDTVTAHVTTAGDVVIDIGEPDAYEERV